MQLYFIRHGQSENNALWDRTGSNNDRSVDPELTDTGILQAHYLAQYLATNDPKTQQDKANTQNQYGFGITHIYSSLMVRAVATSIFISDTLKTSIAGWLDIHEIGGIYRTDDVSGERIGLAGKSIDYFKTHYPAFNFPDEANETGWWNCLVETYDDAKNRAQRVFSTLIKNHGYTDDKVAIVSHAGFYNIFLNFLVNSHRHSDNEMGNSLTFPHAQFQHWFLINNAAISRIDFIENNIDIVYTNRTHFLPYHLIT